MSSPKYQSPALTIAFWVYALSARQLTLPGRMLMAVAVFAALYSSISVRNPVTAPAFLLIALITLDFLAGLIMRPRLLTERKIPARARSGSRVVFEYSARNRGSLPAWDLGFDHDGYVSELVSLTGPFRAAVLPSGGELKFSVTVRAGRRGKYTIPAPRGDSFFPFSIFRQPSFSGSPQSLTVYPAFTPLERLSLPAAKKFQRQGSVSRNSPGGSMDFFGCRDYREGDEFRRIHWPCSARRGKLVVREFLDEQFSRAALILDTQRPPPGILSRLLGRSPECPEFEAALSLAAALGERLALDDYVIDLFAAGPRVYHFKSGKGLAEFDSLLDILACLDPSHEHPLKETAPAVAAEIAGIGAALVILTGWDEARRSFIEGLEASGCAVKTVLVTGARSKTAPPPGVITVSARSVLDGGVREI
jgi:uncharacterized protein (DUF58 family)